MQYVTKEHNNTQSTLTSCQQLIKHDKCDKCGGKLCVSPMKIIQFRNLDMSDMPVLIYKDVTCLRCCRVHMVKM